MHNEMRKSINFHLKLNSNSAVMRKRERKKEQAFENNCPVKSLLA